MISRAFGRRDVQRDVHLLILLVTVAAVFGHSVGFDFVWDDEILLVGRAVYADFDLRRIFFSLANGVEYLPIRDVSYALDYAVWGWNAGGFHLTNLALYALNAIAVYGLTLQLVPLLFAAGRALPERRVREVALLTALLFAVHPVHSEVASFISCRNVLLSGLFFFLSCYFFSKHLGAAGADRRASYTASLLCCVLAILSKATAVVLPGVLLLLAFSSARSWSRTLPALAPFFAVSLAAAIFFEAVATRTGLINPDQFIVFGTWSVSARLAVAAQIPFFYLAKLAAPTGLSALYAPAFATDPADPRVLLGLFALAAALAFGVRVRRRAPEVLFALAWYLVSLFPVLNFFSTNPVVADRYVYLAGFSPILLAVTTLHLVLGKAAPNAPRFVAGAVVAASAFLAFERSGVWKSDEALWQDTIRVSPRSWKAYYNLGARYFSRGEYEAAFRVFERLAELRQSDGVLRFFRAKLALQRGDPLAAIEMLEEMSYAEETPYQVPFLLGQAYERSGDVQKAIDSYAEALHKGGRAQEEALVVARNRLEELQARISPRLDGQRRAVRDQPENLNARVRLAIALDRAGLYEEALVHYSELERRGGGNWSLHYNMGNVYRKLGRYAEAVQSYEKSAALSPNDPRIHNNLGVALKKLHEYERAIRAFETAMELDPSFRNAPFNLATLYFRLGDEENATRAFDRVARAFPELRSQVNPYLEALRSGS